MRIIHEIEDEAQVGGSGRPYTVPDGKRSDGFRVELLISVQEGGLVPEESIYIEGDARHVRRALVDALGVLDVCHDEFVEDGRMKPFVGVELETEEAC